VIVVTGGEGWDWAKWLPHTHEPDAAGVTPLVAERFEGVADRVRDALDAAARRAERQGLLASRQASQVRRHLVVVLDRYDPRAAWARSTLAAELLAAAGPHSAISVICVVEREDDEPTRADVRVRVNAKGAVTLDGRLADPRDGVTDAVADWPEPGLCDAIARELAPLRLSAEGEEILAQIMSLPNMLGVADLDRLEPRDLWVAADDEEVLQLPVGFDANGRPLVLDLKEAAQGGMGPHGLVVGATGSGKSELLRTLVTGLSMKHSPDLLSFVLVDFKGGATFAGVTELPHVAGMIRRWSTGCSTRWSASSSGGSRSCATPGTSTPCASTSCAAPPGPPTWTASRSNRCPTCWSSWTSSASCWPAAPTSSTCSCRSAGSGAASACTCCWPPSGWRRASCAAWTRTCPTASACAPSPPPSRGW
jgi:S-DNA-T family DNA segregation ATPase FtsK/SpoIIIE